MIKTDQLKQRQFVSLFTREWIEIKNNRSEFATKKVSLFTREWIEMGQRTADGTQKQSPSLRGSGLKL